VQATKRARQQRLDRQQWLSRLLIATPRILAAAEYARIRRQIEPGDGRGVDNQHAGRGRRPQSGGTPAHFVIQTVQGDTIVSAPAQAASETIVPIGFVTDAQPQPGTVIAVPQVADAKRAAEVMETRGRRRAKDDIAAGFDALSTADDDQQAA